MEKRTRTRGSSGYTYKSSRSGDQGFLHILLWYILPFIIFNGILFVLVTSKPKLTLTVGETTDYLNTNITVTVDSILPTKNLTAAFDATPLELTKTSRNTYTAPISMNGVVEASVSCFNGMSTTVFDHVSILDDNPPSVAEHSIDKGVLTLKLEDSQSGVNYNAITALDADGDRIIPTSINKAESTITFPMDTDTVNITIQDLAGNEMQASFTSHMEDDNGNIVTLTKKTTDETDSGSTDTETKSDSASSKSETKASTTSSTKAQ